MTSSGDSPHNANLHRSEEGNYGKEIIDVYKSRKLSSVLLIEKNTVEKTITKVNPID